MNVRRWMSGLALVLCGTCCLADEPMAEPVLGRAEPIGSLPVVVTFDFNIDIDESESTVEAVSAIELGDGPRLGPPILLASLIPDAIGEPTSLLLNDPREIHHHLHQAAKLLAAAGLDAEARRVESVLDDFQSKHIDRLTLARKRAELARLQDEIEQLSARVLDDADAKEWSAGNDRPVGRIFNPSGVDGRIGNPSYVIGNESPANSPRPRDPG